MPELKSPAALSGLPDPIAGRLWQKELAAIPSVFGRLVHVASHRNPVTGLYEYPVIFGGSDAEAVDRLLSQAHLDVFSEWTCLDLGEQRRDLNRYLSGLNGDRAATVNAWAEAGPRRDLAPDGAEDAVKQLYFSDFGTLLQLLRTEQPARTRRIRAAAFLFAGYLAAVVLAACAPTGGHSEPRILSLFIVGIGLAAYHFSRLTALTLFLSSLPLTQGFVPNFVTQLRQDAATRWQLLAYSGISIGLISLVHLLKKSSRARQEVQEQHRLVLDSASDGIVMFDRLGRCVEANARAGELLGYCRTEMSGVTISRVTAAEDLAAMLRRFERVLAGDTILEEWHVRRKDGTPAALEMSAKLLSNGSVLAILRDITERKKAEERLKNSLQEKEVLLREVHHRVKNNLQVISSLLDLKAAQTTHPEATAVLQESQQRISAIALVHQQLYRSETLSSIDAADYLLTLAKRIVQAGQPNASQIHLAVDVEKICLSLDQAVPCGLIVNELVLNSLKHAFQQNGSGELSITGRAVGDDEVLLTIRDNGPGLAEDLDVGAAPTLGLRLVNALVRQLRGSLKVRRAGGTEFCLRFPRQPAA